MYLMQSLEGRFGPVRSMRWIVLGVALLATVVKLILAATTFGTNDVHYWTDFAAAADEFGPVGMYANAIYGEAPYNHAPLAGYLLVALNWLGDVTNLSFPFLVRLPASLADIATAVVIFELVRQVRSVRVAAICGMLAVWSPVMLIVSGFHGNTDPVMMLFALLAVYLATKGRFGLSGLAIGLALSVKLIPVILLPLLFVIAVRAGRKAVIRLSAGGLLVFAVLWIPVLAGYGKQFMTSVIGYKGIDLREWGIYQLMDWAELHPFFLNGFVNYGRLLVLAAAALIPAWMVWRRSDTVVLATGLAFTGFLLISSAFSMQYLVWPALAAYLIGPWLGTLFNVTAGLFTISVYNSWNDGEWFWKWYEGRAMPFGSRHLLLMMIAWEALAVVVVMGLVRYFRERQPPAPPVVEQRSSSVALPRPLTVGQSR